MNKTLEAIAQAIFKEWFVDFQFPGFDGVLIDGLPKGWRKGKLLELFQLQRGFDLPAISRISGVFPVVAALNFNKLLLALGNQLRGLFLHEMFPTCFQFQIKKPVYYLYTGL